MIRLRHCGNEHVRMVYSGVFDELFYRFFRNTVPQITQTKSYCLRCKVTTLAKATQFCLLSLVISATVASTTARREHLRKYFMLINVRQFI